MFKPARIESYRGRIPVSEEARKEARAAMGGEQTALAVGPLAVPTAPIATPVASEILPPILKSDNRLSRAAKSSTLLPVTIAEPNHSVKLPKSTMQQIKLTLALLPAAPDNPTSIKQYLEMAHQLLDSQLRKKGKLPPIAQRGGVTAPE